MKANQNISTAVMQRRVEPHDSLDDFPTPPWATRALFDTWMGRDLKRFSCLEPCANRGFMVRPLREMFGEVQASDVHDYGASFAVRDFLWGPAAERSVDFVVTNPPFRLASQIIERAILTARQAVCIFARLSFIEGVERYQSLYRVNSPLIFPFSERVPLVKGRCDPKASTATSYAWFVFDRANPPNESGGNIYRVIPPCRKRLERPNDYVWGDAQ